MSLLSDLLSSRVKAEIFRLLFGLEPNELHVREIARRAGLNDATVRQELKWLTEVGLVEVRKDGNRAYYRALERHPLFTDIRNLVLKTSGLLDVLRPALDDPAVRFAFVFGSLAAGLGKAESDVDVMVIGDITLRRLSERLVGLDSRVGREINPHILSLSEFRSRWTAGDHFLKTVMNAPKLFVKGDEHELAGMAE